jgi:hypothetical protein
VDTQKHTNSFISHLIARKAGLRQSIVKTVPGLPLKGETESFLKPSIHQKGEARSLLATPIASDKLTAAT